MQMVVCLVMKAMYVCRSSKKSRFSVTEFDKMDDHRCDSHDYHYPQVI